MKRESLNLRTAWSQNAPDPLPRPHNFNLKVLRAGEAYWGRVCYQQGLPRLASVCTHYFNGIKLNSYLLGKLKQASSNIQSNGI